MSSNFLIDSSTVPVPSTPEGLRVFRMRGQAIRVGWNPLDEVGVARYRLYHSVDDVTYTLLQEVRGLLYLHFGLSPATHYYKVSSLNVAAKESVLSAAVSLVVGDPNPYLLTGTVATAGVPVTLDIETALSRKATSGSLVCVGTGEFGVGTLLVELSSDGVTWTSQLELRPEDYMDMSDQEGHLEISQIRLDADTDGTKYTLSVV